MEDYRSLEFAEFQKLDRICNGVKGQKRCFRPFHSVIGETPIGVPTAALGVPKFDLKLDGVKFMMNGTPIL